MPLAAASLTVLPLMTARRQHQPRIPDSRAPSTTFPGDTVLLVELSDSGSGTGDPDQDGTVRHDCARRVGEHGRGAADEGVEHVLSPAGRASSEATDYR